jgi:hypothetical protein
MRVGNVVSVAMIVAIDPTAATTFTQLYISLPIASAIANLNQLSGQGIRIGSSTVAMLPGYILGDTAGDRARLDFMNDAEVSSRSWSIHFQYQVN